MTGRGTDSLFSGSIPKLYESHLVPMIFEPYARDMATVLAARPLANVLELAAGTGVVTRALCAALPESVAITATDLNPAMLEQAERLGTRRPVRWRQADAMQLPFDEGTFDAVACQFGVMFFPDRPQAFAQAHRVLRTGGIFIFSVWDRIEENEFADTATRALAEVFPADPPRFLARTPHGYHDPGLIASELIQGGFHAGPEIDTIAARSRADSARIPAIAFCQGTPLRNEIEARDAARLAEATDRVAEAIARAFGQGAVDGKIQALRVCVTK